MTCWFSICQTGDGVTPTARGALHAQQGVCLTLLVHRLPGDAEQFSHLLSGYGSSLLREEALLRLDRPQLCFEDVVTHIGLVAQRPVYHAKQELMTILGHADVFEGLRAHDFRVGHEGIKGSAQGDAQQRALTGESHELLDRIKLPRATKAVHFALEPVVFFQLIHTECLKVDIFSSCLLCKIVNFKICSSPARLEKSGEAVG
ncbi:MAG: hypothetical protein WBA12_12925 [Catalinimonas sp.]